MLGIACGTDADDPLWVAVEQNDLAAVRYFLGMNNRTEFEKGEAPVSVLVADPLDNATILHIAASASADVLLALLAAGRQEMDVMLFQQWLNMQGGRGRHTALCEAMMHGHVAAVDAMLFSAETNASCMPVCYFRSFVEPDVADGDGEVCITACLPQIVDHASHAEGKSVHLNPDQLHMLSSILIFRSMDVLSGSLFAL